MTNGVPILFVLGPSAIGKTKLGERVADDLNFLWIEIDRWPEGDGIDLAELRVEWSEFWNHCQAGAIATTLSTRVLSKAARGAIVTFPSRVVFSARQIMALQDCGIRVLILYGTVEECLESFLKRERELGRNLPKEHWLFNNSEAHKRFGDPSYERYRLEVFQSGQRLDRATLTTKVKNRLK